MNLFRPFLPTPSGEIEEIGFDEMVLVPYSRIIGHPILSYPLLAQLRTFVQPFNFCKLFCSSLLRGVSQPTKLEPQLLGGNNRILGLDQWKSERYILIAGYEKGFGHLPPGETGRIIVGITIRGPLFRDRNLPLRDSNMPYAPLHTCDVQPFQLSPEHRVYGFEKYQVNLDPAEEVSFGLSQDYMKSEPMGKTRIAFRENTKECIFEQAISELQDEGQRWLPFGRGRRGVRVIKVLYWEMWGFQNVPPGFLRSHQPVPRRYGD